MKITAIFLLAGFLQVSANGFCQERIHLLAKNAPLEKVLEDLQKQTSLNIWYEKTILKNSLPVSCEIKDADIGQALDILFKGRPFEYEIIGKNIVIKKKAGPANGVLPGLISISGKVYDDQGEPVAGCTITVRGKSVVAITGADGSFHVESVDENAILVFSGSNVETHEENLNGRREITLVLHKKINKLDEVQIIAYGTTTKRLNTGSVFTVKSEDIAKQPVMNALSALEGRVPGLVVTQSTGVAGGSFSVEIRGRNSIRTDGNEPLYVVDGVPFSSTPLGSSISVIINQGSPLGSINPDEIASIEILKDADATAIYGSRGANGVVLITTRKGYAGKPKFDFNIYTGQGSISRKMPLLNTNQYLEMRHEAFANDGTSPDPSIDYDLLSWDTTRYTDWQKEMIGGHAHQTSIQASVAGGNNLNQYLFSGSYFKETSVFPGDFADQKASVHFHLSANSTNQKFKSIFTGSYSSDNNKLLSGDPTIQSLMLSPDAPPVYDSLGKLYYPAGVYVNPYYLFLQPYTMKTDNILGNALISYEVIQGLKIKSSFGYNKIQAKELEKFPLASINPAFGLKSGFSYFGNSSAQTWIIEPQLEYQKQFSNFKITTLLGSTFQEDVKQSSLLVATGFADDALLGSIGAASSINPENSSSNNNYYRQYKYEAIFLRFNFNWNTKYIINLTGRRDGSSRFGPGKQFSNFGAAGVAWIFSNEKFIRQHFSFIDFGKIRASYGVTGNDQIADYGYLSTYTTRPYSYGGLNALYPTRLFNPDYAWEKNNKAELAIETSLFKERIFFSVAYFKNRSSNQLVGTPLPGITGYEDIQNNFPAVVENKGWEIELQTTNFHSKNFSWKTSINLTIPNNKLVSFPNIDATSYATLYHVGQPLSVVYAYPYAGVDPVRGIYQFFDASGKKTTTPSYPADGQFQKSILEKYYGGFQNSVQYKNWQLDFLFQFVNQTGRNYLYYMPFAPGMAYNQPAYVLDRWQKSGDTRSIQKFTQDFGSEAYASYLNSTFYGDNTVSDASFIRLKNVSLSFQVPLEVRQKMKIQQARIYIQGQNLLTFTHYMGLDPENQSGISLPPLKMLVAGIQLTL